VGRQISKRTPEELAEIYGNGYAHESTEEFLTRIGGRKRRSQDELDDIFGSF